MILKFKLKGDYADRVGLQGPNMFIKAIPPKTGYQNFDIGDLPKSAPGKTFTVYSDKFVDQLIRRKQIIVLEEYTEELEDDKNTEQEGLFDSGDSEISSTVE
jgi:hypothetical protein